MMKPNPSFGRRGAMRQRRRAQRRRMLMEALEPRQAPGSLIPIPIASLLHPVSDSGIVSETVTAAHARRASRPTAVEQTQRSTLRSSLAMPREARSLASQRAADPASTPAEANVRTGDSSPPPVGGGSGGSASWAPSEPRARDGAATADPPRPASGDGSGGGPPRSDASPATNQAGASSIAAAPARVPPSNAGIQGAKGDASKNESPVSQPMRTDAGSTLVLNTLPSDRWRFREFGGQGSGAGRLDGKLWMVEGNSFLTQLELDWTRPADIDRVQFQFRVRWDSDANIIRDAFEAAWVDSGDQPLLATIANGRDAFINATEGLPPITGRGTSIEWTPVGSTWIGSVTSDVRSIPAATRGTFVFRLINNDNALGNDDLTYARLDLTNTAPVARDDEYVLREDETFVLSGPGILANDSDRDDDPIQASLVAPPSNGTLELQPDGSLRYTPYPNFAGTDRFEYRAVDAASQSNIATVMLRVSPVNDPPIALDDDYSLRAGTPLVRDASRGVLANDFDREGDAIAAILKTGAGMGPEHGQVQLQSDGSFVYTPNPGWTGNDYFTYAVTSAGAESEPARARIRITPGISKIVIDSTRWRSAFPFAALDSTSPTPRAICPGSTSIRSASSSPSR